MSAEVLKEFLVELGWKSDVAQEKRFMESIASATKGVIALGAAINVTTLAAVGIAQKISASFEQLAYASSRVNASAANISAFRYAISQLGGTAEGALAALEAFSRKLRESPGEEARLRAYGVRTRDAQGRLRDSTELLKEMFKTQKFKALPYFNQLQIAESMGIDERTFRAILGDVDRFTREYREKLKRIGIDPDAAAENAKKFQAAWRSMTASIEAVIDRVAVKFGEKISGQIEQFTKWIDEHGDEIANTLDKVVTALISAAKYVSELVAGFMRFIENYDPLVKKLTGIESAFAAIATVLLLRLIPGVATLTTALAGLVAGAGWRGLVAVLAALGLGGAALAAGAAAAGLGGGMLPSPAGEGEDEFERQRRVKEGKPPVPEKEKGLLTRAWEWVKRKVGIGAEARETSDGQRGGATPGSLRKLIEEEAKAAGIDPRIMFGIHAGESAHGSRYDRKDDAIESSWGPFQLNRRKGLGAQFEKETGLDVRDPSSIPEQTRWVARYIARHGMRGVVGNWFGYHGNRDWNPKWGEAGYSPPKPDEKSPAPTANRQVTSPTLDEAEAAARRSSFARRFNAGGPMADPVPMAAAPGTHNSFVHSVSRGHTLHQKTNIVVNGAGDPGATARTVAGAQARVNSEALRNLQGAAR